MPYLLDLIRDGHQRLSPSNDSRCPREHVHGYSSALVKKLLAHRLGLLPQWTSRRLLAGRATSKTKANVKSKPRTKNLLGRRLVFGQLLRVLGCSGTGPESPTDSPDLLYRPHSPPMSKKRSSLCFIHFFLFPPEIAHDQGDPKQAENNGQSPDERLR